MGERSEIGWTDSTWNPVRGCSRKSEGCRHCYAEAQAARIVRMGKGKPTAYDGLVSVRSKVSGLRYKDVNAAGSWDEPRWTGVVRLVPEHLADPLRWRTPRRVFVNSMSDLFHESLTNEQIAAVFGVMAAAPQHTFQVLTKRADRMRAWFEWITEHGVSVIMREATERLFGNGYDSERLYAWWRDHDHKIEWTLRNVWLGVSVENQDAADERIPDLLRTPAAVRFLSCEPLLGPVDLNRVQTPEVKSGLHFSALHEQHDDCFHNSPAQIDWVIDGCESGPSARPAQREWFASIEEQCRAAGVAYFHKQEMVNGKLVREFPGRQEFPQ